MVFISVVCDVILCVVMSALPGEINAMPKICVNFILKKYKKEKKKRKKNGKIH